MVWTKLGRFPRCCEPEWMDEPRADPRLLRQSLAFIRRVNAVLGYTRSTLLHLERFSRHWKRGETIHILDLATGSGDVPRAILGWAARRGLDVRVVGVDRHPQAVLAAREQASAAACRMEIVQADVFALPFASGSFDYVISSMFLHHLDEEQIAQVLRTMDRLARRGIVAADLLRHRRAYLWIRLLTLFASPMVRHDAVASVAQALTREEVLALTDQAGLHYVRYHRHAGHRFVLSGEKTDP